jgi:hypothetical protein
VKSTTKRKEMGPKQPTAISRTCCPSLVVTQSVRNFTFSFAGKSLAKVQRQDIEMTEKFG